ncbi:hypothetical protein LZS85_08855 [Aliivibrio fischeri]|uniref:hypothetical protein n=1 Tax=Aliivibrio fischeri TaxID=668 RepID=UPI001F3C1482|nr:hypothetical protein [Aliivibrio fischeri]MCE7566221.1 hypothetical protein [Aliivibrio fischeri]
MPKVTLDDDLFIEYFKFKNGKSEDHSLVHNFFSHLKMPFVKSPCQIHRCHKSMIAKRGESVFSTALLASFLSGGYPTKSLEELAKQSKYRIILTSDPNKHSFPYLNVNSPNVELNYSKSCTSNVPRNDLIDHIKSLCVDANKIIICDNYFFSGWNENGAITTEPLFDTILPKKQLDIEFVSYGKKTRAKKNRIETKHSEWTMQSYTRGRYSRENNHDRYLVIEKPNHSIEVMLSSGFLYLWKLDKEINCVFREL